MWRLQLGVHLLFIIIYAKESYCLLSNEKSEDKSSSSAPPLSSFQQYTNAIPSDQPVTPHGRRDVETSVKAYSWPSTIFSPLCEAWAYFESERNDYSLSWKYLDTLVERGGVEALDNWIEQSIWTFDNSTALAIEIASQMTQSNELDRQLLPMALSLRAHSPHCEMHRSLARDAAIAYGLYDFEKGNLPPSAFCLLSRRDGNGNIVGTQLVIYETLLPKALDELKILESSEKNVEDEDSHLLTQLPGESIHPTTSSENDEFVAILYGQAGTSAFASLYKSLRKSQLNLVVRHMGFIPYEENKDARVAFPTVMQGYGVRLDIRNVEYKAFDDGPADNSEDGDATSDWNEVGHHPEQSARNEYLGGLNLHTIFDRLQVDSSKPLATDLHALQTAAIRSHSFQLGSESIIPPAWQRRSLSMQAASLIVSSPDPLEALKGISQNLPSVAHSLSNIQISESFEALAETATDLAAKVGAVSPGWGDAAFGFYVNSREVNIERPSFNIFQLLNVLREEDATLRNLEVSVRPALKKAADVTEDGSDPSSSSSSAEWAALQSVRKMMEMGANELAKIGKSGDISTLNPTASESHDDESMGSVPGEKEGSQIFRIDVGRGGKNAILYLNDIEKDAQYSSWPTSVQEMLYRSQFGGAPTVRRNLFTMLLVIDPADGSSSPVLDVVAQLLNAQFPLRLGVLIVNQDDVEKGLSSEPLNWDNGARAFHASDSFLLLKHITNKYGGMAALNCLFHMLQESAEMDDTLSVEEFINAHVSLLVQMGVVNQGVSNVQDELTNLLRTRQDSDVDSNPKNKNLSYESAVQFAKDKLIRPGMSFYNGIPLPTDDASTFASKINSILRDEQDHIMGLVMSGVIKDRTPKSVYATILSGDNLFKQYHPLLDESSGEYFIASAKSNDESLLLLSQPKGDYNNVDALFVVEAMIDLDDSVGIDAVSSFLEVIISASDHSWHDSKTVSLAARILPTGESTSSVSQGLGSLFCAASCFDVIDLKAVVDHIQDVKLKGDLDVNFFDSIEGLSASVRRTMTEVVTKRELCHGAKHGSKHLYTANGRVYVPRSGLITLNDIKLLVNLELDRTTAITKLILKNLPSVSASSDISRIGRVLHHAIGRSAAALNKLFSSSTKSEGVSSALTADLDNPLFLSWNEETSENLQVEVSVILDPLTEPTQRVAPLLLAIRDVLKLPLKLIIAPRTVVDNDVPLSSYYRFVVDPLASASNPPKARFENLPTNHLLTLRMDVPELWDVQQAHGVQDSDNLRCDSRFGCGDEGYILSRGNRAEDLVHVEPTKGLVELTQIDYSLKSLLLFGQCYDVSKNTPPNGLQLTLDRMSLAAAAETEVAEILVDPDGSIGSQVSIHSSGRDHADTLVMKTAGYFQLRSNPGVWSLRIEEKSRGSEIYHLVDGKISASGQVSPAKTSVERKSKTLVAKDFTSPANVFLVKRKKGFEDAELYLDEVNSKVVDEGSNETVHVFSLATGHAYERLLKIMMLSVTKRTSAPVKFWLFSNFLSPSFKSSATYMAEQIGCEVEFVTYKWPEWLRGQSEKQRIIWGYKILFLDVLFPLDVKKIIYVDADQVIRGDLTELWNLDLDGAPYGYTPFCDSREETLGYQFWRTGFWKSHLRGRPYHISALYVVDLERFRRELVGDKLRSIYQQLSADPNSLANLDQDLPNYAQHDVRIFSLPQKWLWCESWCSDETKAEAMTIDLCNNPEHKEAKISMAKRIISGDLFEESWEELDEMVRNYDGEFSQLTKLL